MSEKPEIIVSSAERHLPVYLLLDTSSSMTGAPIEAVRRGVEQFKHEVEMDPFAIESVYVGVITFGGRASFVTKGLVPIDKFEPPMLSVEGGTPLGQALWLLNESLDKDVKVGVMGKEKGDYKPLVFILTDGEPTDDWQKPREEILKRQNKKVVDVITIGCGPYINQSTLKEISVGNTFNMGSDEAAFKGFFKWVTQSVARKSKTPDQPGSADKTMLEPPDTIQPVF